MDLGERRIASLVIPEINQDASRYTGESLRVAKAVSSYWQGPLHWQCWQSQSMSTTVCMYYSGTIIPDMGILSKINDSDPTEFIAGVLFDVFTHVPQIKAIMILTRERIVMATNGRTHAFVVMNSDLSIYQSQSPATSVHVLPIRNVQHVFLLQSMTDIAAGSIFAFMDGTYMLTGKEDDRAHWFFLLNHLRRRDIRSATHVSFVGPANVHSVVPVPRPLHTGLLCVGAGPAGPAQYTVVPFGPSLFQTVHMHQSLKPLVWTVAHIRRLLREATAQASRGVLVYMDLVKYALKNTMQHVVLNKNQIYDIDSVPLAMIHKSGVRTQSDHFVLFFDDAASLVQNKYALYFIASLDPDIKRSIDPVNVVNPAVSLDAFSEFLISRASLHGPSGHPVDDPSVVFPAYASPIDLQMQSLALIHLYWRTLPPGAVLDILGYVHNQSLPARIASIRNKCVQWILRNT